MDGSANLFESFSAPGALAQAFKRVKRNKGGPGGDGVTVGEFAHGLERRLDLLAASLREGWYRPGPLRLHDIPKPDGRLRHLAVPCVRDRVAQAAAAKALSGLFDAGMAEGSFAYRPRRSIEHALALVAFHALRGFRHVVDGDILDFFGRVPHGPVLAALAGPRCPRTLAFVTLTLASFGPDGRGLAQGSPLSPLLSNLVLTPIDRSIATRRVKLVRYADDFLLMTRTAPEAKRAAERMRELLAPLGLELNAEKTRLCRIEDGVEFLGAGVGGEAES
jgi:CRISPR-associated protein Cas1